tara:strand:- start:111 stop:485 length:375 start_codon:yes stop_codon:yes gene_type:complete
VNLTVQDNIYKFQKLMQSVENIDLAVQHHFSKGLYARELFIPKGVCLVGALHKTRHMFMVVTGTCRVSSQFGNEEITGPFIGETQIGTKRVIYAETDCVWMTYHPTNLTDIAEIEDALLVPEEN